MFKLQKNVPIPTPTRDFSNVKRRYPYRDMEIGDFFFVPGKEKNVVSSHASTIGRRLNRKFTTRMIHAKKDQHDNWVLCADTDKGAEQGIGVWREEMPEAEATKA